MLLYALNHRVATAVRLLGLAAVMWSVLSSSHFDQGHGRGVTISVFLGIAVVGWMVWTFWSSRRMTMTPDLFVIAAAGGYLTAAASDSAASALAVVAVMSAGIRSGFGRAVPVLLTVIAALGISALLYDSGGVLVLAYALGLSAATLGGSNIHQTMVRADDAELLLAQTQRSHEEQLRVARLEESARIAREIHDVLAHSLAGLAIQLEATEALLDKGANPQTLRERISQAHELAVEGLRETRRAVGALREQPDAGAGLQARLQTLAERHRQTTGAEVDLRVSGEIDSLATDIDVAVNRLAQEALTNAGKHAAGAAVAITVVREPETLTVIAENGPGTERSSSALSGTGGGYGLQGMRERAELLGGSLEAGPVPDGGWRVEMRLPLGARQQADAQESVRGAAA